MPAIYPLGLGEYASQTLDDDLDELLSCLPAAAHRGVEKTPTTVQQ